MENSNYCPPLVIRILYCFAVCTRSNGVSGLWPGAGVRTTASGGRNTYTYLVHVLVYTFVCGLRLAMVRILLMFLYRVMDSNLQLVMPGKDRQLVTPGNDRQPVTPGNSQPVTPGNSQPVTPDNSQPVIQDNSQPVTPGSNQPVTPGNSQVAIPANSHLQVTIYM